LHLGYRSQTRPISQVLGQGSLCISIGPILPGIRILNSAGWTIVVLAFNLWLLDYSGLTGTLTAVALQYQRAVGGKRDWHSTPPMMRLSVSNGTGTTVIRRTGFAISVAGWTTPSTEPERVSQSESNYNLALLTSKRGQTGGARSIPTDSEVSQFGVGTGISGLDSQFIQQQTTGVEDAVFDIIVQAAQKGVVRQVPASRSQSPPLCSGGICRGR
jgi:hypothetical protein